MTETQHGLKIPLLIDGAMLMLVIFMAGGAWFKIDALADDVSEIKAKDLPERVVRIEEQVKSTAKAVDQSAQTSDENQELIREILRRTASPN